MLFGLNNIYSDKVHDTYMHTIFVQYFWVIDAFIRPYRLIFFTSKCKLMGINSCLVQNFRHVKLTDVQKYQTKHIVYTFTEI